MVDAAILQEWISKAEDDFQFARISLEESKPTSRTMSAQEQLRGIGFPWINLEGFLPQNFL